VNFKLRFTEQASVGRGMAACAGDGFVFSKNGTEQLFCGEQGPLSPSVSAFEFLNAEQLLGG
jgi:hypothetical protein